ncbi:unnamed protein product [Didymodactylos carnosus]|uniref:Uncharacterized protein n=1 Tax=Didymodactylos carnosus TaxID=1234261 RepID=A0A8S2UEQ6_9BILA|nr:unnamed protein product [Didymodactylos carnosus]CAF4339782.1 unnamed protein product [Didymodactylos carnosus]
MLHALLHVDQYLTTLTIYNPNNRSCLLSKNTLLGTVKYLCAKQFDDQVINPAEQHMLANLNNNNVHHIQNPLENSIKHLQDESQGQQVKIVSERYHQIFDINRPTEAKTSIYHTIKTNDYGPVNSRPHRGSWDSQQQINKHVQQMLNDKQVRESTSPWSSPALVVKNLTAPPDSWWILENLTTSSSKIRTQYQP